MKRILLRGARQLLTLRGPAGPRRGPALNHLGIIDNGAVLIDKGMIVEVGPTRRVENLAQARNAVEIDATGHVVMPGFVDCHAHLVSGRAGGASGTALEIDAIASDICVTPAPKLRIEAERLLRRMCLHGTTTVAGLSGFGLSESAELKCLKVMSALVDSPVQTLPVYFGLHRVPGELREDPARYAAVVCEEILPSISRRGLTRVAHAACGPGNFGLEECSRFFEAARGHALALRMDFGRNGRDAALAEILDSDIRSVDHLDFAEPADVVTLAGSPSTAVLLPGVAFHRRDGRFAPARRLVDSGAAVALGTGFESGSAPGASMVFAIYLACRYLDLTVAEAITAATANAAQVLRLDHRVGTIEPGKQADLIMIEAPGYEALACEYGVNPVQMVIKGGEIVVGGADIQ